MADDLATSALATDPARHLDAAIFDFDGTIALSGDVWHQVDTTFFARRGLPLEPDMPAQLAALGFEGGARLVIERYGLAEDPQAIMDEWNELAGELYSEQVELREGVAPYLRFLRRQGVRLGLATTNSRAVLASLAPRIVLDELFDAVACAAEVGADKHSPAVYLACLEGLGSHDPARTIVFEDIPTALATARDAGFVTCGVISGDPLQDVTAVREGARYVLDDWTTLPQG